MVKFAAYKKRYLSFGFGIGLAIISAMISASFSATDMMLTSLLKIIT